MREFALERYFAEHEFSVRHLLSCSDTEPWPMAELLALAEPDLRALWDSLQLGYTDSLGHPRLRELVAAEYAGLSPIQVLVAAPEECIYIAMHSLLAPGDRVICTYPGYQSLFEVARSIGCQLDWWQPREAADHWHFDLADLRQTITGDTRLVVVNFPHNPTGAMLSRREFDELINIVDQSGAVLFFDEMYRHLEHTPLEPLPSAAGAYGRAISLGGLSKSYGLAGLRVGWLVSPIDDLMAGAAKWKDYTTICSSAPSEILAIIALENRAAVLARQKRLVADNLEQLRSFVERHRTVFEWREPAGGAICFCRLAEGLGAAELCRNLIDKASIMLLPATVFEHGNQHVRFGFGRRSLGTALNRLENYLALC